MDQYNNYIGLTLDERYSLKRLVGVGGMAMVFEADDMFRKTVVAVKILKEEFASDEVSVQRFINESKAVLMLSHSNIVKIFDVSVKGEYKYIVMEYIDGITLKNYMETKGVLSVKETISYTIQILRALEHAHIGGIIHRDIKPQNIMLLNNGQIKVTDFGIAKLPDAQTITATDKAIGTVYYISPEQAAGEKGIDRRTDLYSVGVMMYEMLTGKLPFDGENPVSIALKQINEQPKAPTEVQSTIPKGLEQIILFAMEKDKDKRFQTATQMIELLQKIRENPMIVFRQKAQPATANKKKKKSRKATLMPIVMGVIIAFILVLLCSGIWVIKEIFFNEDANVEKVATVENYVGKVYSDVESDIRKVFYIVNREYVDSTKEEKDVIVRQSPAAGEELNSTEITVYIGKGIEETVIGDYSRKPRTDAQTALSNKGLKCDYEYQPSADIPIGHVISTLPEAGETVLVGTTVTLILSSGDNSNVADTTQMPQLVGMTTAEAYGQLVQYGLRFHSVSYAYSDDYDEGVIIEQSPSYDTIVSKGIEKVSLTISKGKPPKTTSTVPLINGKTLAEATEILKQNDLSVGQYKEEYSDTIPVGTVFDQFPTAGNIVDIGANITFAVSLGQYIPPKTTTNVPVIEGCTVTEAEALLVENGLVMGEYTSEHNDAVSEGIIFKQTPDAGEEVDIGSSVTFVVSLGKYIPPKVLVPSIAGYSIADAEKVLTEYQLVLGEYTSEYSDTVAAGMIIRQTPEVNSEVEVGSSVTFIVSLGKYVPPVVTTEPPVVTTAPPVVTTEPPVVTTAPPVVTTAPPVVTTAPPVVTTAPPVVTTEPPVVTTELPVVTTAPPVVTTEPPVVTTAPPVVTTEPPVVTTEPPVVTTAPPVVTTEPPVVTTAPPVVTTAPPVVTAAPPVVTTAPLAIITEEPMNAMIVPEATTISSAETTEAPVEVITVPEVTTEPPVVTMAAPVEIAEVPEEVTSISEESVE